MAITKLILTGFKGTIGKLLINELVNYNVTPIDLPEIDISDYSQLLGIYDQHDAIIHLAWTKDDASRTEIIEIENSLMFMNIYTLSKEKKIKRVIMASSIHTDNYLEYLGKNLLTVDNNPFPTSPYGAHKIFMEKLGHWYSRRYEFEVICIRFGGVYPKDKPITKEKLKTALSYNDCVGLIDRCLKAKKIKNNYEVINAVSNNKGRVHDYSNSIGWIPKDDAFDFYSGWNFID